MLKTALKLLFKFPPLSCNTDVIINVTYVSPDESTSYDEKVGNGILQMQNNIEHVKLKYPDIMFLLMGNLNARTKIIFDYIQAADISQIFGETSCNNSCFDLSRQNKDMRCNAFGKSLIHLCCTHDMHIVNRRFNNLSGNLTCFSGEGACVVIYMISCEQLFNHITYFEVVERDESDHLPISCSLKFNIQVPKRGTVADGNSSRVFPRFKCLL